MSVKYNFNGKVAVVTGASKGIGRAISLALANFGCKVYALSKTESSLREVQSKSDNIVGICVDLSNWEETEKAVKKIDTIHYLINNAGISKLDSFMKIEEKTIDSIFGVNVKAVINVSQLIVKQMIRNNIKGAIVNISSVASLRGLHDHLVYCASKGALDQITRVMALELGEHKIRVNSVNPTVVMTDMGKMAWSDPEISGPVLSRIPLGKFAEIDEIVGPVLFLLSDSSSMINGNILPIEGGLLVG